MTPAHQIAEKLTEDQAFVIARRGIAFGNCQYAASVMRPLGRLGLFKRVTARGFRDRWTLTKRGEQVRAHLLSKENEHD
ncbi:hypothetical protein ACFSUK_28615 [Sphingobium scionense]|uniref:Uncharacterized protein n=1 Tax=Sphingobium scionense TaxID=1404341 RepID=A0A7W6LPX5_9SPHN|nr:hypothetical protein [Sphingobium scionense]MBB4148022.1 hypothetical protein [Sphingobium scionense]